LAIQTFEQMLRPAFAGIAAASSMVLRGPQASGLAAARIQPGELDLVRKPARQGSALKITAKRR
jgi:hypothetical protein